jgi:hypothetical protein
LHAHIAALLADERKGWAWAEPMSITAKKRWASSGFIAPRPLPWVHTCISWVHGQWPCSPRYALPSRLTR